MADKVDYPQLNEASKDETAPAENVQSTKEEEEPDNLTKETIEKLENELMMGLAEINGVIAEREAEIDILSTGHEKEIEALKLRDEMLAQKEAEIAKNDLQSKQSRNEIDSIQVTMKNIATKKSFKEKERSALEQRLEKKYCVRDELYLNTELYKDKIQEYSKGDSLWTKFVHWRYESKLKDAREDTASADKEIAELREKIASVEKELEDLDKRREECRARIQILRATYKESEQKNAKLQSSYEGEKAAAVAGTPDWYVKLKQAEMELKQAQDNKNANITKLTNNEARVKGMRHVVLKADEEGRPSKEVLIDEDGELYGDTKGVEQDAKRVSEEQKVETRIKALPLFQVINEDTIQEFLKYNPDTGGYYEEDEEVKGDSTFERSLRQIHDMALEYKPTIQELLSNPKLITIDSLFEPFHPLKTILTFLITEDGLEKAIKECNTIREEFQSDAYRKQNPFKYNLAGIIFKALGSVMDISDKGALDDKAYFKNEAQESMVPLAGTAIGGFLSTLIGMLDTKDLVAYAAQAGAKAIFKKSNVEKSVKGAVKGLSTTVEEAFAAENMISEIDFWEKENNPQYVRIMAAARRASINNSVNGVVDAASSITKGIFCNEKFTGTLLGWGISAAAAGLKFVIGLGFGGYDKSALLNSPEVFGGLKYDDKLVPDEKFNQILRKCTGITSKDKVYSAVKTTDAIAVHQRMLMSLQKPDYEVERLLSSIGYKDKVMYPNIRVADLMKKTGHEPTGGDWRRELKDTLLVEGEDYRTLMQSVGDGFVRGYKTVADTVKDGPAKKKKIENRRRRMTAGYSW